ncbi:MAG: PC4/YdbC family ssDNA-binding protein [Halobacteriovoraceae bacterium]|nr:PC4/YdbC family ssDNA-binding protein [Halobacteriovoraceae bacterium]
MKSKLLGQITKNKTAEIYYSLATLDNEEFYDLRIFFKKKGEKENYGPSKKGVCIRKGTWEEVLKFLLNTPTKELNHDFEVSKSQVLKVSFQNSQKYGEGVDFRIYYKDKNSSELKPSPRGVRFSFPAQWIDFSKILKGESKPDKDQTVDTLDLDKKEMLNLFLK